jgi:hypothetical protein
LIFFIIESSVTNVVSGCNPFLAYEEIGENTKDELRVSWVQTVISLLGNFDVTLP